MSRPTTLGALRSSEFNEQRLAHRGVKQEMRDNLVARLKRGEELFPGIIGFEDTVIPQIVNAILSSHNFILLGLRGQAKSRILRSLISLLDAQSPSSPAAKSTTTLSIPFAGPATTCWPGWQRRCHADRLAAPRATLH